MTLPALAYVIDDEVLISSIIKTCLSRESFEVYSYSSCEAFLKEAKLDQPFLMIVDKNMPGLSGIELIAKLRSENKVFEAILVTGYADMESAIHAVKLGLFSYIEKPFNLEHLVSTAKGAHARLEKLLECDGKECPRPVIQTPQMLEMVIESLSNLACHAGALQRIAQHGGAESFVLRHLQILTRSVDHLGKFVAEHIDKAPEEKGEVTGTTDLTSLFFSARESYKTADETSPLWGEHLENVRTIGDPRLIEDLIRSFLRAVFSGCKPDGTILFDLRRAKQKAVLTVVLQAPLEETQAPAFIDTPLLSEVRAKAESLMGELAISSYLQGAGIEYKLLLP